MPLKPEKRPSGIYRIRGTHHGIRVDRSSRTRSFAEAQAIAEAWERKIYEERVLGRRQPETFAQLAIDYMNAGYDLGRLSEEIITEWGDRRADTLTSADAQLLANKIYGGTAPASRNRWVISPISAIMNWAADSDRVPLRKWRRFKDRKSKITKWKRPAEIEAVLAAMTKPETQALTAIYVGCGLRAAEGVFLPSDGLSPDLSKVKVAGTLAGEDDYDGSKSSRDRSVPIPPRARELIRQVYRPERARAFYSSRGAPYAKRDALDKTLRAACIRAGIEPIGAHALRHTFATWHNAVHGDNIKLMQLGGWSSLSLVERYAHAADDELADEVISLGWAILGQNDERRDKIPLRFKAFAA